MEHIKTYENFHLRIALFSNLVSLSIYAIGIYVLAGFGILFLAAYLIYCLWLETRLLMGSCVNCYYYGRVCAFGKGRLCSMLFKKGDPKKFLEKEISWRQIIPDFLVFIIPLAGGALLLVGNFSWLLAVLLAVLAVLSFGGTAFVRSSYACKYCRQRELGCPAQKLFANKKR
jgi:hypothetical protein